MMDTAFLGLIQNAALLLAAAFIFDVATTRWRAGQTVARDVAVGLATGVIGIIIMVTPWTFIPGIVFDTRSVLIGISGLFLGWLPAAILMAMTVAFRLFLGGGGAWTGVGVIILSGAIGIAWRHFRGWPLDETSWRELYLFGIVVHLAMLAMMLTLPWETALRVLSNIIVPVLAIYPVGTALLGTLMVNRLHREKSEEELRAANTFLDSVIENIPDMIFVKDARDLCFVRFNRAGEDIWGYSREDILGKNVGDFVSQEQADLFTQQDQEALQKKKVLDIPEDPLLTRNMGMRIRHTKKVPILDANGNPEYLLGISEDITEQKQKEAERERLLSAIEQAGEIFITMDAEGVIQYVNPAFTSVTGYTREEALGQNARILKSVGHEKGFYRDIWATISRGDTFEGRIVNKRQDGTTYIVDSTISPVFGGDGKIVSYVIVSRDITEHIRLSEQLQQAQKMEAVGRLAGGVAHDFNNMLGVIIGHAEMALEKIGPGHPFYDDFNDILKAAERSADLTRQLLAFARKQTVSPVVLDLNVTVEGMLKMLRRLIGENIHLAWLPGADLPLVWMDPVQIDQMLANLCLNARDAIAGVGRLTIETGKTTFDNEYCAEHAGFVPGEFALLAVSDDGCGMDKGTLENIFEPFFTTKGLRQGTGLGLATVYGIVKQNGGFVNVYSEPGQGTTFKIYLPRHAGQFIEPLEKISGDIRQGGGETVLLVEDESVNLELGKIMLESFGYSVLAAGSPGEALRLAEEHAGEVDLLMTDVVMPEMNGRELAGRLQALYPGLKCLFMSGYTANVIAHNGVLDEGVHFLQKPFSRQGLAEKVRTALT
ncbi:MAG: PAS domain S-box protein [Syntrophales bacterium]|jgi:PAS domain S-box-containing protein|nr:PAS domain S-box protein [Syntrophales bacterium]